MKFSSFALASLTAFSSSVTALSPAEWRSQSIYQVLTDRFARTDGSTTATCSTSAGLYCGGTWQGIITKLDYIQGMGFTAIWISPVVENLQGNTQDGEAYHGYWGQDIYALNSNFGTMADLVALSDALHKRGMYLMVDIVTNHMGYAGAGAAVDYSVFTPFSQKSYFHDFCLINYTDVASIPVCWEGDNIVSLPDLRTEDAAVLSIWESWVTTFVKNYTIDGLRVDSVQQVDQAFFPPFQSAAGVHMIGEVFNGDPAYTCPYQNYISGVLNYPTYFYITAAFSSITGSMSALAAGINDMKKTCGDTTLLGSFLENHDNARFPSITTDVSLAKNAIAFTMLQDGTPIIYEGQEQHLTGGASNNANREAIWLSAYDITTPFYTFITVINKLRTQIISKSAGYVLDKATAIYTDTNTIAMRKGDNGSQIISVYSNKGASAGSYTVSLAAEETGFEANEALVEVVGCTEVTVDGSGDLAVTIAGGLPRVFFTKGGLDGSGVCPTITGAATGNTTKSSPAISSNSSTSSSPSKPSSAPSASSVPSIIATPSSTPPTNPDTNTTCTTSSATISVTFNILATTTFGQTIKLSGSSPTLGSWNLSSAIALSASAYTSSNPLWSVTLPLAPEEVVEYKFLNVGGDGKAVWEGGDNRTVSVNGCVGMTVEGKFQ